MSEFKANPVQGLENNKQVGFSSAFIFFFGNPAEAELGVLDWAFLLPALLKYVAHKVEHSALLPDGIKYVLYGVLGLLYTPFLVLNAILSLVLSLPTWGLLHSRSKKNAGEAKAHEEINKNAGADILEKKEIFQLELELEPEPDLPVKIEKQVQQVKPQKPYYEKLPKDMLELIARSYLSEQTNRKSLALTCKHFHHYVKPVYMEPVYAAKLRDCLMDGWKGFDKAKQLLKDHPIIAMMKCLYKANPWQDECSEKAFTALQYARFIGDTEMEELIIESANMYAAVISAQLDELDNRQGDPTDNLDAGDSIDWGKMKQRIEAGDNVAWASAPTWAMRVLGHIYYGFVPEPQISGLIVSRARRALGLVRAVLSLRFRYLGRVGVKAGVLVIESHCIRARAERKVQLSTDKPLKSNG